MCNDLCSHCEPCARIGEHTRAAADAHEMGHPEAAPVCDHLGCSNGRCSVRLLVEAGEAKHEPTPVRFHLADDRPKTFEGWSDGSTWNGWSNVTITPEVRAEITEDLRALWLAEPSGITLDDYLSEIDTLPVGDDGRVSLAYGYCVTVCDAACAAEHDEWLDSPNNPDTHTAFVVEKETAAP
jgi:hypothetical protein